MLSVSFHGNEPITSRLRGSAKTVDFRATAENEQIVYIDVKTIKPIDTDRWGQFEKAKAEGWLPKHIMVSKFGTVAWR